MTVGCLSGDDAAACFSDDGAGPVARWASGQRRVGVNALRRPASGAKIVSFGGRDAFDVIRPTTQGVPASLILRDHHIDDIGGQDTFTIWLSRSKGVFTTLVPTVTLPNYLGTISWTARAR